MIVAAALCPAPPLLIRDLTGAEQVATDLRGACLACVAELTAAAPDVIAVVGAADGTATWAENAALDLARYAPGPVLLNGQRPGEPPAGSGPAGPAGSVMASAGLPSALGVGAWLLDEAVAGGQRLLQSVGADEPPDRCARLGAELAGSGERVAFLVMADGSARRGLKAPGYFDERSAGFDAQIEDAVRAGELDGLLTIDQSLARELMATGRPAWQVLAGAMAGHRVSSEIRYCDDPFGVAYLVASLRVHREP